MVNNADDVTTGSLSAKDGDTYEIGIGVLDADAGTFTLVNSSNTVPSTALNLTYADYTYCADGYNKDAGSRSMLNLILIFVALAILAFVIQRTGVLDSFGGFR